MNSGTHATTRQSTVPERTLLLLSLLIIIFVLCENLLLPCGRDQGIYAVTARTMLEGGAPYRDAWDFKPPGIYFIYAAARLLFGSGIYAVRILESLGLLSLVIAFALFSRRHFGSAGAGIVGGALTLLVHTQFDWWQTGQPESFGAVLLAWAVLCATYRPAVGAARPRPRQIAAWTSAGMLYTAAALCKPPLGGGFVVSLALVIWYCRRSNAHAPSATIERERSSTDDGKPGSSAAGTVPSTLSTGSPDGTGRASVISVSFIAGALLVLLACLLYFVITGALGDLYRALFLFAPRYTAVTASDASFPLQLLRVFRFWLFSHSWVGAVGLVLALALPVGAAREREGVLHVAGILLMQAIGVAMQSKFFAYHFGAIFPFTALLAGWGYWKLLRFRGIRFAVPILLVAFCTLQMVVKGAAARTARRIEALARPEARERIYDRLYSIRTYEAAEIRDTSRWLREHTPADEPVFVWGFLPVIYLQADRALASRYIYNIPQRMAWDDGAARRTLLRELTASSPAAIVVAVRDNFRAVTGNDFDSGQELRRFPELQQFVDARYTLSKRFGNLFIFLRNDLRE